MNKKRFFGVIILTIISALLISACTLTPLAPEAPAAQAEEAEHNDGDEHGEEADTHSPGANMAGMHSDIPEEAAAIPNPIEANDESFAVGGQLYATNCAVCHGESGKGDGPGAAGLDKKPANLNEGHVQELSDGGLFYIISHGKPDTPMPAWDNVLSKDDRWQVIIYLRSFNDGEGGDHAAAEGEHTEDGGN